MAEGDLENWQEWLARHRAALFLMARQYLATSQEAEDAVQEGFVRFWQRRARAADAVGYLFACVRTAALDLRRARLARERGAVFCVAPPGVPPFFDATEGHERRAQVEFAIAELPEEQREVVVLKIWGELTFSQIGSALGIPVNTAASRYRYALARLETLLSKEFKNA